METDAGERRRTAARGLLLAFHTAMAIGRLNEQGIGVVLLKGPAVARWLYTVEELRPSTDIDLLVAPDDYDAAAAALGGIGFWETQPSRDGHWSEYVQNEGVLVNDQDVVIDLHRWMVGIPPDHVRHAWDVLRASTVGMEVGGREVPVLDEPARAMHLALHAAQNGREGTKSLEDLRRGLERLPAATWDQAAAVADEVGARAAFLSGLRLLPAGRQLADRLGVTARISTEQALRSISAPEFAQSFGRKFDLGDARSLVVACARELWPSRAATQAWHPEALASRGAYVRYRVTRPFWVLGRVPSALAWVWRARREQHALGDGAHNGRSDG
jgi:putative nucleotidyltransferase-like protein